MNRWKKATLLLFLFLVSFLVWPVMAQTPSPTPQIETGSQDQKLAELQDQIKKYEDEISRLRSQSSTLTNQIAQYDAQIKLAELQIEETQTRIYLLESRIGQLEISLDALAKAFSSRAVETYKMVRLGEPVLSLISSPDLSTALSQFYYLKMIQKSDQQLMTRLQATQVSYEGQKKEKEALREQLEKQKANLDGQKAAKANLLIASRNDEKYYQQLLTQAKNQLAAMRRFVTGQGGASILQNQTKCDGWGCYYNQRDSQWGNIGIGGSSYSMAEYGCLISSIAMVASHYGKKLTPGDIAVNSNYFVPGTGYIYHQADGMPFSISPASKSNLDSLLTQGPVIAGLYSGPDHFIVILKKDGDNYIMHDPFMPDGANRPLTDKYSIGNITSLRLVSFK